MSTSQAALPARVVQAGHADRIVPVVRLAVCIGARARGRVRRRAAAAQRRRRCGTLRTGRPCPTSGGRRRRQRRPPPRRAAGRSAGRPPGRRRRWRWPRRRRAAGRRPRTRSRRGSGAGRKSRCTEPRRPAARRLPSVIMAFISERHVTKSARVIVAAGKVGAADAYNCTAVNRAGRRAR